MASAYSLDLRERAVAAVLVAEQPQAQVAALFGVALATLTRGLVRWRGGQHLQAGQSRHGPAGQFADPAAQEALRARGGPPPPTCGCATLAAAGNRRAGERASGRAGRRGGGRCAPRAGHGKKASRERRTRRGRTGRLAPDAGRPGPGADRQRGRERFSPPAMAPPHAWSPRGERAGRTKARPNAEPTRRSWPH